MSRKSAEEIVAVIDRLLPKWLTWFPDDESIVDIPRCHLLMLVEAARIGVAAAKLAASCSTCGSFRSLAEVVVTESWVCARCQNRNRFRVYPETPSPLSVPAAPTAPGSVSPTAS